MNLTTAANEAVSWDWGLMWAIVNAVVGSLALIGVAVALVAYRRQFPKRRVAYGYDSRSLLRPHGLPQGDLEVRIQGTVVGEPHFVELQLWSESRADIPSDSFDAKQPITFDVRAENVVPGWSAGEVAVDIVPLASGDGVQVVVAPQLIRKRGRATVTFVTDGKPTIESKSPLIDIPLAMEYDSSERDSRPTLLWAFRRLLNRRFFRIFIAVYLVAVVLLFLIPFFLL